MDTKNQNDLRRIVRERPGVNKLAGAGGADPIPASEYLAAASSAGGGAGISSPLTETDYSDRQYWGGYNLTSTDGLFVISFPGRLKKLFMEDANNRLVEFVYQDKPT